jgi:hypothetical protein
MELYDVRGADQVGDGRREKRGGERKEGGRVRRSKV